MGGALEHLVLEWKLCPKGTDYDIQELYRQYLKYLYRCGNFKKLISEALSMIETFSKDPYPLEWICKLWVELLAEGKDVTFMKDSIPRCIAMLESLSPLSSAVCMASGASHYYHGELLKARDSLNKGWWKYRKN